jgi:very-short-patch-repair endonuclease
VASHRAAAALWKLKGIDEGIVEVTSPKKLSSGRVIVHCGSLTAPEITTVGGIPSTTATRTLLDLGAVTQREIVEAALPDALQRGLTTNARLQRILDEAGGKGRRGAKALRSITNALGDQNVESILELKLLRLLRRSRLPDPVSQFSISEGSKVVARVDFAYPEIKLAIEADGYRHHGERYAWKRDLKRRNALTARGWHVIHVTWSDVADRPGEIAAEIRDAVRRLTAQTSFFPP